MDKDKRKLLKDAVVSSAQNFPQNLGKVVGSGLGVLPRAQKQIANATIGAGKQAVGAAKQFVGGLGSGARTVFNTGKMPNAAVTLPEAKTGYLKRKLESAKVGKPTTPTPKPNQNTTRPSTGTSSTSPAPAQPVQGAKPKFKTPSNGIGVGF